MGAVTNDEDSECFTINIKRKASDIWEGFVGKLGGHVGKEGLSC